MTSRAFTTNHHDIARRTSRSGKALAQRATGTMIAASALLLGCSGPLCDSSNTPGLKITVKGGGVSSSSADEAPSLGGSHSGAAGGTANSANCVAVVTVRDGDYSQTAQCYPAVNREDCLCIGANDRVGNYTVTATVGTESQSQTAEVTKENECHVKTVNLTFEF